MASLYQRFSGKINTNNSFPHPPPEASRLLGGQVTDEDNGGKPRKPVLVEARVHVPFRKKRSEDEALIQSPRLELTPRPELSNTKAGANAQAGANTKAGANGPWLQLASGHLEVPAALRSPWAVVECEIGFRLRRWETMTCGGAMANRELRSFKKTPGLSYRLAWIEADVAEAAQDVSGEAAAVYVGQQQQQGGAGLFPG
ncbi:unnamed protein product [Arctogadus glacialis]